MAPAQVPKVGLVSANCFQLFEPGFAQQFEKCTGLSSGDDQAVNFVQLLGFLNQHNLSAQLFEPAAMRVEITLQGQDTDFHAAFLFLAAGTGALPAPRLQHLRVIQAGHGQALHGAHQIFANFQ